MIRHSEGNTLPRLSRLSMLFLDSIGIDDCATWVATEIVSGITCSTTILAKAGEISVSAAVRRILALEPMEVHALVLSECDDEAFAQAKMLAELDPQVKVKIPIVASAGRCRSALIRRSCVSQLPVNVTASISLPQLYYALSLGPGYISVLRCRLRDAGTDPAQVVRSSAKRRDLFSLKTRIVMGSIREPDDVTEALTQPADIVTVPPLILEDGLDSPASLGMAAQFAADAAGLTA
jgi:transaldolase